MLARAGGWALAAPNVGTNSGMANLKATTPYPGGGIELDVVAPAGEGIHDTPKPGVTAVMIQIGPTQHGTNSSQPRGKRTYAVPYNGEDGSLLARKADAYAVPSPYRELHAAMLRFFDDAFRGKVPVVSGMPAAVRDTDADGIIDAME
ncbi:MAG: hypothetical protein JWP87_6025 [Labilithrix sp.]|nr:hypothetical protein [Labilithrix sp.]